jgi:hypothetical protein
VCVGGGEEEHIQDFGEKARRKETTGPIRRREDNIKMDPRGIG